MHISFALCTEYSCKTIQNGIKTSHVKLDIIFDKKFDTNEYLPILKFRPSKSFLRISVHVVNILQTEKEHKELQWLKMNIEQLVFLGVGSRRLGLVDYEIKLSESVIC